MNFEKIEHGLPKGISGFATDGVVIDSVMFYISKLNWNLELIIFHVEGFGLDHVDSCNLNACHPCP